MPFLSVNIGMENFENIKERILTDSKVANAVEYLLSKVVLDQKLPQLKFFFKKHKIILSRNGLYSVYKPTGEKIANHIHYQEVAKYIVIHSKNIGDILNIQRIESEMFRHKDKILYFMQYNKEKKSPIIESKIQAMFDYYYHSKNALIHLLQQNNLYQ